MSKQEEAGLILKLYELRREAKMREARDWYYKGRHVLGVEVTGHRMEWLTRIIKSLLTIIPNERGYKMREDESPYSADLSHLLDNPPMSDAEQPHAPRTTHHVSSSHAPRTTPWSHEPTP